MSAPVETGALPGVTGVVTIDLGRLAANWRALSRLVAPAECSAVVKADAYGLGAEACIPTLAKAGCRTFFVATYDEALAARRLAPAAEVLMLDGLLPETEALVAGAGVAPVLSSLDEVRRLGAHAQATGRRIRAALHVCSGLNRLGLPAAEVEALLRAPQLLDPLDLVLVMSHLASADNAGDPQNARQLALFEALRTRLPATRASLAASDGLMLGSSFHFDLVRPGYALYGGQPSRQHRAPVEPVVRVHTRILQVRDVMAGESVGYSGIWRASRPSRLATIAAGYADGIPRMASRASAEGSDPDDTRAPGDMLGGVAAIGGARVPMVGRVSMDLVVLDISALPADMARPGAWVELIGPTISLEEAGTAASTIGYEILTRLGRRFHRVYLDGTGHGQGR